MNIKLKVYSHCIRKIVYFVKLFLPNHFNLIFNHDRIEVSRLFIILRRYLFKRDILSKWLHLKKKNEKILHSFLFSFYFNG